MKKYLIHAPSVGGHQLEYLHHLYEGAIERPEDFFYFLVPQRFTEDSKKLIWPETTNVKILVMEDGETPPNKCGILKKAWINSKTIGKYVKEYDITDVIVISMIEYIPFLPLHVKSKVRVRGIIYRIYLYEWKEENWKKKVQDAFKYWLMRRCKVFNKVFILNDTSAAHYLQRLFKSDKFCFLPDPVASLRSYHPKDVRNEVGIPSGKLMILHAGGMISYKGTINILKALDSMDKEECEKFVVVFAGQKDKIEQQFNYYFDRLLKKGIPVKLEEGFIPFERLADLFYSSNFVLIPYSVKSQSSGIVGHAAYYERPVVVVRGGVIGKMVRKWHLGNQIASPSVESIAEFLRNIPEYHSKENNYTESHSISAFYHTIYNE